MPRARNNRVAGVEGEPCFDMAKRLVFRAARAGSSLAPHAFGRQPIMWDPGWTLATIIASAASAGLVAAVVLAVLIDRFS